MDILDKIDLLLRDVSNKYFDLGHQTPAEMVAYRSSDRCVMDDCLNGLNESSSFCDKHLGLLRDDDFVSAASSTFLEDVDSLSVEWFLNPQQPEGACPCAHEYVDNVDSSSLEVSVVVDEDMLRRLME